MFETLNYLVELTVSIYFLCIFILFVVNVCEFMPRVDHSTYKDDVDVDEPPKINVVASKSKSGVSINDGKGIKTKSGTKRGGSSQKVAGVESGKIEKEGSMKAIKPKQASSKSVVSKQSKQGSKTKVDTPEAAAESTDDDVKTEEEVITDEEANPAGGIGQEQSEAKRLSKISVKSGGSKKNVPGDLDAPNVEEETGGEREEKDERSPAGNDGSTAETAGGRQKSENPSKSSMKISKQGSKQGSIQSVGPRKSGSQTINDAEVSGSAKTQDGAATQDGAETQDGAATQDEPTAEQEGAMVSIDVPNDPVKKPTESLEVEEVPTESNDGPPPE